MKTLNLKCMDKNREMLKAYVACMDSLPKTLRRQIEIRYFRTLSFPKLGIIDFFSLQPKPL